MKIKISRQPKIKYRDSIEMSLFTSMPLWKDKLNEVIVERMIAYGFTPEIIDCIGLRFIGYKGLPFSKENLKETFKKYCSPNRGSVNGIYSDVFVLESVSLIAKKNISFYSHISIKGGRLTYMHNSFGMSLETFDSSDIQTQVRKFFDEMCQLLLPDFARIQFYSHKENAEVQGRVGDYTAISPNDLNAGIPDLYAVTLFGRPYIEVLGRENLLASPCYRCEEISNDLILLQLGEHLFDERGSKESLKDVRQAVKSHLDKNAFFDPDLPSDHKYNVPEFDLSEIRAPIELPMEKENEL